MTQEELKSLVHYDPETGLFTWLARPDEPKWTGKWAGKTAGHVAVKGNGYRRVQISLNSKIYKAHRLAWLYQTGSFPAEEVDHRNRDATDNRWENLRLAEGKNQRNKSLQRNNKSGVAGVSWSKSAHKWIARAWSLDGRYTHIGLFASVGEAAIALERFRSSQGYSESHGRSAPYRAA